MNRKATGHLRTSRSLPILLVSIIVIFLALLLIPFSSSESHAKTKPQIVTSTSIIADIAKNIAGDRAKVVALVPPGADPHSYEPTLRDIREVAYADAAFTNYMMLEEHALIKAIDTNLPPGAPNIALAEDAAKYSAEIIPLVEDASLDTVWLGLRVRGEGKAFGANRSSEATITATKITGPGELSGYLTGTFGQPQIYFQSADGVDAKDTATLPLDAHTHMSWAFSKPGIYTVDFAAALHVKPGSGNQNPTTGEAPAGTATVTFVVGTDPAKMPQFKGKTVIDGGHVDITADVDKNRLILFSDPKGGGEYTQKDLDPSQAVIYVPTKALQTIPGDPSFRFLGRPGTEIYLLAQAVLGKHVHGEIDPHLWHDVRNAKAYAKSIRDTLIQVDPAGAATYSANTEKYLQQLDQVDQYVRTQINMIPPGRRTLVTTHDAYGYLAHAYGLKIAGFVTQNPGTEPSVADRVRLARTMRDEGVPAVFLEPYLPSRNTELMQVAQDAGAKVCPIYSDTLDEKVPTYLDLMRFNADSLRRCLGS
ncbi:anchored repeat ABC transporter, substrate-binding protein [Boudabousia liubingyangii]|uniref:anchored repeat ABC transporter, substrate-binding protein n=1 Tax=Boudabousia liubingyangii TaxID=1921764 RepID=UPI000B1D9306|nr:anchored repeat ABC transporter, substrate-binding protein [Boudabousia liubingyangii]